MNDDLQILIGARERLNRGWTQHQLWDYSGSFCALGAIDKDTPFGARNRSATRAVWRKLPLRYKIIPVGDFGISIFNDMPWRKKKTVLRLFDRAIKTRQRKDKRRDNRTARRLERMGQYEGLIIDQMGQIIPPIPEPIYVQPEPVFIAANLPALPNLLTVEKRELVDA